MRLRGFLADTSAIAAVEMALILPFIALIFVNVADATSYVYSQMQVDLAAQEAAGIARAMCDTSAKLPATVNCAGLTAAMEGAAQATSLGADVTLSSVAEAWYCSNDTSELIEVAAITATPPTDCSATLSGSTAIPGEYIAVTATYSFSPVFPGASVAASLPADIERIAWIRLQ